MEWAGAGGGDRGLNLRVIIFIYYLKNNLSLDTRYFHCHMHWECRLMHDRYSNSSVHISTITRDIVFVEVLMEPKQKIKCC